MDANAEPNPVTARDAVNAMPPGMLQEILATYGLMTDATAPLEHAQSLDEVVTANMVISRQKQKRSLNAWMAFRGTLAYPSCLSP